MGEESPQAGAVGQEASESSDTVDLHCPICDYSLRALPEPRCPECGYAFEWAELIEQTRRRQLWFYEHARTFRSHLKTRWRSLWPRSFWKDIHAYSDASSVELTRYQFATLMLIAAIGGTISIGVPAILRWARVQNRGWQNKLQAAANLHARANSPSYLPGSRSSFNFHYTQFVPPPQTAWEHFVSTVAEFRLGSVTPFWLMTGMSIVWIVGMAFYWKLLKASVLKARIKPIHLARVNAYTSDVLPWLLLAAFTMLGVRRVERWPNFYGVDTLTAILIDSFLEPALILTPLAIRLWWALRRYVRFPQATAVTLGYVTMFAILGAIVFLNSGRF